MEKTKSSNPNSLVFFGTGPVSLATIDYVAQHFPIEAVITKPDKYAYGKRIFAPVAEWAKGINTPLFEPANSKELTQLFTKTHFNSSVGLVVDYGLIIPKNVIGYFPKGIVNSHFSLLPQLRGADPITAAILSGQPTTGVSLMLIVPRVDEGKLLAQAQYHIPSSITIGQLTKVLTELSNQLIVKTLPKYLDDQIQIYDQDPSIKPTYSRKVLKADGKIDWRKPASILEREIRAYLGWPGSYTRFGDTEVIITKASVRSQESGVRRKTGTYFITEDKQLAVQTGQDFLLIETLKPRAKPEMSAQAFLNGYKIF